MRMMISVTIVEYIPDLCQPVFAGAPRGFICIVISRDAICCIYIHVVKFNIDN